MTIGARSGLAIPASAGTQARVLGRLGPQLWVLVAAVALLPFLNSGVVVRAPAGQEAVASLFVTDLTAADHETPCPPASNHGKLGGWCCGVAHAGCGWLPHPGAAILPSFSQSSRAPETEAAMLGREIAPPLPPPIILSGS